MKCCKSNQCVGIEQVFDEDFAKDDLEEYHSEGPGKTTDKLLKGIREHDIAGASLMDIGGGVGVIQHELVRFGVKSVTSVDASTAYAREAQKEAARLGYVEQVQYHEGDFVQISPSLAPADIVTMDRVICCYDDMPGLVSAAVSKANKIIGFVYPVDRSIIRLAVNIVNFFQMLLRRPFRIFAHATHEVDEIVKQAGFKQTFYHKGLFWQVVVYAK